MTVSNWIDIGQLVMWLISIIGTLVLGRVHFKNKRAQRFSSTAQQLMKAYVGYYDKQEISNPDKLQGVIQHVVTGLQAKGFKVTDQDIKNIEAGTEAWVTTLHNQLELTNNEVQEDVIVNDHA